MLTEITVPTNTVKQFKVFIDILEKNFIEPNQKETHPTQAYKK